MTVLLCNSCCGIAAHPDRDWDIPALTLFSSFRSAADCIHSSMDCDLCGAAWSVTEDVREQTIRWHLVRAARVLVAKVPLVECEATIETAIV